MEKLHKRAISILLAGVFFNLSVGVLYSWSVLKLALQDMQGWTAKQAGTPYTLCIIMFSVGAFIGGRLQDKYGPRWVVTTGGILVGLGLLFSGFFSTSPAGVLVGFGILTGLGIGLGYSSVTPPAFKWFHASKKGFVSGFIVGGFGFGAVFYAPLTGVLLNNFNIAQTFLILGAGVLIISTTIAQLVTNPPAGYVALEPKKVKKVKSKEQQPTVPIDHTWKEMIQTKQFYFMITLFLFLSSAGMMIIGNITRIASLQAGMTSTTILVSFLALMNFGGRFMGGALSDKIGRINMLFVIIILQAINMSLFRFYTHEISIAIGIILAGTSYGAILGTFPALTADQFGLKYYGFNFGIVYMFWGLSAVLAPLLADYFFDIHGNFEIIYNLCAGSMVVMGVVNYFFKRLTEQSIKK
ncbi:MAG: OFA family MFS transporter [Candidatus Cloacimonetes bacterium]|nr:OFA family MFS transporter [Candidatus Cloacimonadota bacterium]